MPPRIQQGQLERGLGGAKKLLQLADRNRTGFLTDPVAQAFIEDVLNDGNAEVDSYIGMAVDLSDPSLATAPLLMRYELAVDVYLAWLRGAGVLAVPPEVKDEYERSLGELQKIALRTKGLGLKTRPAASQQVTEVTKSCDEPYFSPRSPRRRFDGWS